MAATDQPRKCIVLTGGSAPMFALMLDVPSGRYRQMRQPNQRAEFERRAAES